MNQDLIGKLVVGAIVIPGMLVYVIGVFWLFSKLNKELRRVSKDDLLRSRKVRPLSASKWISLHDEYGEESPSLLGNRAGLIELRDRIDEALESGEAIIPDGSIIPLESIKVAWVHPRERPYSAWRELRGTLIFIGIIVAIASIIIYTSKLLFRPA